MVREKFIGTIYNVICDNGRQQQQQNKFVEPLRREATLAVQNYKNSVNRDLATKIVTRLLTEIWLQKLQNDFVNPGDKTSVPIRIFYTAY